MLQNEIIFHIHKKPSKQNCYFEGFFMLEISQSKVVGKFHTFIEVPHSFLLVRWIYEIIFLGDGSHEVV